MFVFSPKLSASMSAKFSVAAVAAELSTVVKNISVLALWSSACSPDDTYLPQLA
jgi:hypothetical protein